ncbi:MAG: 3-hydroxybutyryl-CoA dehydrogenase [Bacteroidota bacterium]
MIERIAVVGGGTMGNGIAHVCAQHGRHVTLIDLDTDALARATATIEKNLGRQLKKERITQADLDATLARIETSPDLAAGVSNADLVIEAVSEQQVVKSKVFKTIDEHAPAHAILASNTSSISITWLGAETARPGQVIGMHFFNPVPVMKLVEIVRGLETSDETFTAIEALAKDLSKTPVSVSDYPGFVSNRILMPMINEAVYCVMEGVATVEDIDTVMKLGMAHPMGPLTLADFIGLDVCLSIMEVLHHGLGDDKYRPCPLLRQMVTAGRLGRKSGRGFYSY